MCSEIAIKVTALSKCYQIYTQPIDRLKQFFYPRFQKLLRKTSTSYFKEFWALKEVSFEIKKGETVGIIGRNGSGKSTLLQMICGTLNPTSGNIQTIGRIAALLELGAGFNPEFTGRENIYMNGAVIGLSEAEIDARFNEIAAFSDIGHFIEQPVKTYSSGMLVRLAFAVQTQISPDVLIVDEALAVGDAQFQVKCFNRLKQLKERGTSILLVTHSSEQIVTHCNRAILLECGELMEFGNARMVVNRYMDLLFGKKRIIDTKPEKYSDDGLSPRKWLNQLSHSVDLFATRTGYNPHEYRWGDGRATILDFELSADGSLYPAVVNTGQKMELMFSFNFLDTLIRPVVGITIKTKEGVTVYGINSESLKVEKIKVLGRCGQVAYAKAVFCCRLASGDYFISLGIATREGEDIIPHDRRYDAIHFTVRPVNHFFGLVDLDLSLSSEEISVCT